MKVSILLPLYGEVPFLKEAIESVICQTFQDWELIVISDPPLNDDVKKILKDYLEREKRIKYLENFSKLGFPKSLNKGLKEAKGEYIARIDADDIWASDFKLEKQLNFLERNKEYLLVGSGGIAINDKGEEVFRFLEPETDAKIRQCILFKNPFIHSSVLFRKSVIGKIGNYNEKVPGSCDYDFWLRIGKIGKFYNLPEYLVKFRVPTLSRDFESVRKQRIKRTFEDIKIIKGYKREYPHFYKAICIYCLKLIYLSTFARLSKLDNYLYQKRQTSGWRI